MPKPQGRVYGSAAVSAPAEEAPAAAPVSPPPRRRRSPQPDPRGPPPG
ncbi:hypothetical protein ACFQZ4_24515 [Catellatospora coxensis]